MPRPGPEPLPTDEWDPLVAVIDSCVFPRRAWLDPILSDSRDGFIVPIWSPSIISEANRLLTWRWIRFHGDDTSPAAWRRCSDDAKQWFALMSSVFRVVDDYPPHEPAWGDVRDEWDLPLWSAAGGAGANFIVTANLRDGPPPNEHGVRFFGDVLWMHPEAFAGLVRVYAHRCTTGEWPTREPSGSPRPEPTSDIPEAFRPAVEEALDRLSGPGVTRRGTHPDVEPRIN